MFTKDEKDKMVLQSRNKRISVLLEIEMTVIVRQEIVNETMECLALLLQVKPTIEPEIPG